MKLLVILLISLFPVILCAPSNTEDLDGQDDDTLEEFLEYFHEPEITDPEEKEKRAEALKENEEIVKEQNQEYLDGKKNWADMINEFSDLPNDEFIKEETGAIPPPPGDNRMYFTGAIEPAESDRVDDESERFFAALRQEMKQNQSAIPSYYNSVALGHVTSIKAQNPCGSCTAFANMALIETCFKRITGVASDYSEQQLLDCGYGQNGANGCDGAPTFAYTKWAVGKDLLAEATYPYKYDKPALTCPTGLPTYNRGAKVTANYYTYMMRSDEELLKAAVAKFGAASVQVDAGGWKNYRKGVWSGCTPNDGGAHSVTVVGYGTENGEDYWLIKNSWGENWGELGYIKLRRGQGQCGIGKVIVVVTCEAVPGPTSATLTTEKPCIDVNSDCPEVAKDHCFRPNVKDKCYKSCGLCKGMTPVQSNTCYDTTSMCPKYIEYCWQSQINSACMKSCGLCKGMTPVASYTCYDESAMCASYTKYCDQDQIKSACKKSCGKC